MCVPSICRVTQLPSDVDLELSTMTEMKQAARRA